MPGGVDYVKLCEVELVETLIKGSKKHVIPGIYLAQSQQGSDYDLVVEHFVTRSIWPEFDDSFDLELMMKPDIRVLIVSRDEMLLRTREMIIGAYFHATAAGRLSEAKAQ